MRTGYCKDIVVLDAHFQPLLCQLVNNLIARLQQCRHSIILAEYCKVSIINISLDMTTNDHEYMIFVDVYYF